MEKMDEAKEIDNWVITLLNDKSLNGLSTYLKELERGRFFEERYFELYLKDKSGRISEKPIVAGLYFAGRGKWIKPWVEIRYFYSVDFQKGKGKRESVSLSKEGRDLSLFRLLAGLVPPGGHLTVEYQEDETGRALALGIPPAASPLGYLMWQSGFRWFKNWYFPEGWREGGTKLQGNKPLDEENRRKREEETAEQLQKFLESLPGMKLGAIGAKAGRRAREILAEIEGSQAGKA